MHLKCLGVTKGGPQELENGENSAVNVNNISQNEQVNIAGVNNITMSQSLSNIKKENKTKTRHVNINYLLKSIKQRTLHEITNQVFILFFF